MKTIFYGSTYHTPIADGDKTIMNNYSVTCYHTIHMKMLKIRLTK